MTPTKEILGKKYGLLTVIGRCDSANSGSAMWKVLCDCGKETIVNGYNLRSGHTTSCGDRQHRSTTLPKGEASFKQLFWDMKRGAAKRDYSWNLTMDYVRSLTKMNCYYCGKEPTQIVKVGSDRKNGSYIYNGLDRINNVIGYEKDNVVPCCKDCNYAKRNRTQKEFQSWILDVYSHVIENAVVVM